MEPKCHKPNKVETTVDLSVDRRSEQCLHKGSTVGGRNGLTAEGRYLVHTHKFRKLHLEPEIVEVKHDETDNNHTQHEHVLRFPFYALARRSNGITVVAARMAVLDGEPDGIRKVNDHKSRKTHGSH